MLLCVFFVRSEVALTAKGTYRQCTYVFGSCGVLAAPRCVCQWWRTHEVCFTVWQYIVEGVDASANGRDKTFYHIDTSATSHGLVRTPLPCPCACALADCTQGLQRQQKARQGYLHRSGLFIDSVHRTASHSRKCLTSLTHISDRVWTLYVYLSFAGFPHSSALVMHCRSWCVSLSSGMF